MSGKSYTMREMKTIVDYLAEHKAYHEIKGRKMWIDLQDSKVTNRTWQSLKETFIKRILPDISNPYYKLSTQQITSFKQGYDVEARINNRLEMRSVSRDSNTDGENQKKCEDTDSHDNKTGEENKETDIRDSTETVVLENYEDPEDKQDKGQGQTKTLRELITYSEPLTPMLQVIEDYTSDGDGSNDEPKMQIVEAPEMDVIQSNEELIVVLEGSDEEKNAGNKETINNETSDKNQTEFPEPSNEQTTDKDNNGESILLDSDIPPNKETTTLEKTNNTTDNLNSQSKSTENISNSTTDTFLPGNQEALNDKDSNTKLSDKALATLGATSKRGKRRANSQENHTTSKKRLIDSEKKTNTDVETLKKKNKKIDVKKLKQNVTENLVEESQQNVENDNQEQSKSQNMCADEGLNLAGTSQNVEENTRELENPCLKSVSLYEEQFSNKKYTDSDNTDAEDIEENNKIDTDTNEKVNTKVTKKVIVSSDVNEVVVLKSNSESVSDSDTPPAPTRRVSDRVRQQRDRALANMFGFASGGVTKNRRRTNSYRKHATVRRKSHNVSTDTSEWTSDTGSEYVSPPRGRKNQQTRKYLKPKSARVLSLEEEGGLFVMYGKKIYPVVKDGKIIKNYVSFTPDDDVDSEESYWKLKYVEEKKRTAELTKLLNKVKDKNDREERIPEVPPTSVRTDYIASPIKREAEIIASDNMVVPVKAAQVNKIETSAEEKTVKVKFTKNNEEVQLEGHWSHVNPVLAQVLQLLQKEPEPRGQRPSPKRESVSEVSSIKSSSVIVNEQDVRERVNKLESEIFKEIEQIEKEVQSVEKTPTSNESLPKSDVRNVTKSDESVTKSEENVTKRKGRPRKSQTNQTDNTPTKKSKLNLDVEEDKPIAARRTPRTPKKTENNNVKENSTPKTRQNTPNKMKQSNIIEDSRAKYKLPSPNKNTTTSNAKEVKNTRLRKSNR